ncbi:phage protein [Bacillus cereus HuB4-4]|uniref:Phage protein n=1 Tax=Bacillus cereus HuB4-4 TaxID=1053211 RepID=A0A9W5VNF3_BACCE|nr:phage protein [Bacillus cereus]EOP94817.1 phage protein [Bacillus cereus HuB4-4]
MFDWLKDYQKLEEDIDYLDYNLDKTKAELKRWVSGDLREVRLTAESEGAKVEERLEAIEYELAHKMNDMYKLKKLINTFKGLEHRIAYLKYVEGMTLEKIAEELNYSPQYIYNKHAAMRDKVEYSNRT